MILAIDIGNTNMEIGGFVGDEINFVARLSTNTESTPDEYAVKILSVLSMHGIDKGAVTGAVISSVVPPLTQVVRTAINFIFGIDSLTVGPGVKTGLNIHCDNPASVGADLICACVAAHKLYKSPSLIIDMGTATKMMVVGRGGAFIGVSIMPGILMGLESLSEGTAQLPSVSLEAPQHVLGKNTPECMKSGAVFGHASMIDGMIDRIFEELEQPCGIYATGGLSRYVIHYCKHDVTVDEHLVLKGLNIIYNKNR